MLRALGPRPPSWSSQLFIRRRGVEAGMAINAYFSFSGMITFKNWARTDRLTDCPTDRLLVETDATLSRAVPHRGKRNEPGFVRDVAERAGSLRGEPFET